MTWILLSTGGQGVNYSLARTVFGAVPVECEVMPLLHYADVRAMLELVGRSDVSITINYTRVLG